jgi:hypothetical protein
VALDLFQSLVAINATSNYDRTKRDWISRANLTDFGINYLEVIAFEPNNTENLSFKLSSDLFIPGISTTLTASFNMNQSQEDMILREARTTIKNNGTGYDIEGSVLLFQKLGMDLGFEYQEQKGTFGTSAFSFDQQTIYNNLRYSVKRHQFSLGNRLLNQSQAVEPIYLANLMYRFEIPKKRTFIEFEVRNIFDENRFVQGTIEDQLVNTTTFPIRGRQMMLTSKWMF